MLELPASAWTFPRRIAHRGGGTLAPENTLAAFEAGYVRGYRAAELDAVLSADEVPVILHDETLDRTTDGRGPVARRTAAELARLDAGAWYGRAFTGERLPTLQQVLERCWERGIWLNIEIKPSPGSEARTGTVVAAAVQAFFEARRDADPARAARLAPLLSSFAPEALEAARAAAPGLRRGLLVGALPADWLAALRQLDAFSLHCDHRRLARDQARAVRTAGAGLMCYTVNDPGRMRELFEWGVDAICTDRIDLIAPA
jgi:glycerophosphoryl diester phosphodiesterase